MPCQVCRLTGVGIEACAELVADMLRQRDFVVQFLPTTGNPVVVGRLKGSSDRTLLCYNHYDVQPEEPRESILEIQVNVALTGHDLGPFEPVEVLTGEYEARCRQCNQSAWVGFTFGD